MDGMSPLEKKIADGMDAADDLKQWVDDGRDEAKPLPPVAVRPRAKAAVVVIVSGLVLAAGFVLWLDPWSARTKAILWVCDVFDQINSPSPPPKKRPPHTEYPGIIKWPAARIEAYLDANRMSNQAWIDAALAYKQRKDWPAFWRTVADMESNIGPDFHFCAAMRKHYKLLRIPAPERFTDSQ